MSNRKAVFVVSADGKTENINIIVVKKRIRIKFFVTNRTERKRE